MAFSFSKRFLQNAIGTGNPHFLICTLSLIVVLDREFRSPLKQYCSLCCRLHESGLVQRGGGTMRRRRPYLLRCCIHRLHCCRFIFRRICRSNWLQSSFGLVHSRCCRRLRHSGSNSQQPYRWGWRRVHVRRFGHCRWCKSSNGCLGTIPETGTAAHPLEKKCRPCDERTVEHFSRLGNKRLCISANWHFKCVDVYSSTHCGAGNFQFCIRPIHLR
jgi:hypothetical protein